MMMNNPGLIIGISGKMGSGKDTIAKEIMKSFPEYNFRRVSFGYNVKKIVSILTGFDMRTILSRKVKSIFLEDWNMTVGELFQQVGTNALRDVLNEDTWILSLFNNVNNGENIIITDVRFENEANAILNRGGYLIRVNGDPKKLSDNETRNSNHKSETELDNFKKFDIVYENLPPIENLQKLIEKIKKLNICH